MAIVSGMAAVKHTDNHSLAISYIASKHIKNYVFTFMGTMLIVDFYSTLMHIAIASRKFQLLGKQRA